MKTELEEVAEIFTPQSDKWTIKEIFIAGAQWQAERSFSEQEIISLLQWLTDDDSIYSIMYGNKKHRFATNDKDFTSKELLEQFKKK